MLTTLRRENRLRDEHAVLVSLATTLADQIDEVVADPETKKYTVDRLCRALVMVVTELLTLAPKSSSDPVSKLLESLSTPTPPEERWVPDWDQPNGSRFNGSGG